MPTNIQYLQRPQRLDSSYFSFVDVERSLDALFADVELPNLKGAKMTTTFEKHRPVSSNSL
jgi:hypothetical protein